MEVLARFGGRNGEITIVEERATGARFYHEAGVYQSYVLAGGAAGLDYVRLMARILEDAKDIVLFGCGGGALATELHASGSSVTVADDNAISFDIARQYLWMPHAISCVVEAMASFLETKSTSHAAIGVDIGGPCFDYDAELDARTCALLRRRLADGGLIAINIACDWTEDDTPSLIANRLRCEDLEVAICNEVAQTGRNSIIVASDGGINLRKLRSDAKVLGFFIQSTD